MNSGDYIEGKVGNFIQQSTDFANKVKDSFGNQIGDIDCATKNTLIEVKKSTSAVKTDQIEKYINPQNVNYFNVDNKLVILYIDEPIDYNNSNIVKMLEEIKKKGVIVVNSLEELKGVLR